MLDFYLNNVRTMRQAACLTIGSGADTDHNLHLRLYTEELNEFLEAEADKDLRGKADALGDTVVVACGYILDAGKDTLFDAAAAIGNADRAATANGIDLPAAFMLIHESNMSKLCTTDQVEPTRIKYLELGVEAEFRDAGNGMWSAFAANEGPIPKGKWLKGVGFFEPAWHREEFWKL